MNAGPRPAGPSHNTLALWALMAGNLVIGTAVMLASGTLNEIAAGFAIGVETAGLLVTAGAIVMGVGAPIAASMVGEIDRKFLLPLSLAFMGVLHGVCALLDDFSGVLVLRSLALITPALFTAQAAAACRFLAPPDQQGRAIGFVFMGWSVSAVLGVPLGAWIAGTFGWRSAFGMVGVGSLVAAALLVWALPANIRPARMSITSWRAALASRPIMLCIAVTALASSGQFVLFSFVAPYFKHVLGASSNDLAVYFAVFGSMGVLGSLIMTRLIDRIGSHHAVLLGISSMGLSLLAWPVATGPLAAMAISVPWGLACFATNSAQQARLAALGPSLVTGSVALNSSAMYGGQAVGSAVGAWAITQGRLDALPTLGLLFIVVAVVTSVMAHRSTHPARPS